MSRFTHSKPDGSADQPSHPLDGFLDAVQGYYRESRQELVNSAAGDLEQARLSLLEAAKKIDRGNLPTGIHRDVLFQMDGCRDLVARLTEFSEVNQ